MTPRCSRYAAVIAASIAMSIEADGAGMAAAGMAGAGMADARVGIAGMADAGVADARVGIAAAASAARGGSGATAIRYVLGSCWMVTVLSSGGVPDPSADRSGVGGPMSREPEATVPAGREMSRELPGRALRRMRRMDASGRATYDAAEQGEEHAQRDGRARPHATTAAWLRHAEGAMTASDPPSRSRPLRVVVVDDHPMYRDGLRQMLATTAETEPV